MAADATIRVDADASGAKQEVSGLGGAFGSLFGTIASGTAVGNIFADVLGSVVNGLMKIGSAIVGYVGDSLKMNASLETATLQFQTFMGSAEAAQGHVRDLFDFAARTPFESGEIINASLALRSAGGAALDTKENLTLLGNTAAATNAPIQELGSWSGRMFATLQAGKKDIGEAALRLVELKAITPQVRMEMENMLKTGASGEEVWNKFTTSLQKFDGAMALQEQSFKGLTSTFHDNINILGATAFAPFFELTKEGFKTINDLLQSLRPVATNFGIALGEAFRILGAALGPVIQAFLASTKSAIAMGESTDFVTTVTRSLLQVFGLMLPVFAAVVRGVATVIGAYYEIRIAGNLLLTGFGKMIEGMLEGVQMLTSTLAKIPGPTQSMFQSMNDSVAGSLADVRRDLKGLQADTEGYAEKNRAVTGTLRTLADGLDKAGAESRKAAQEYVYHAKTTGDASKTAKELTDGVTDLGFSMDATGGKTKKNKEVISEFAKTASFEIDKLHAEWEKQPPAIKRNEDSIQLMLAKYEELRRKVTDPSQLRADLEQIRFEHQKALPVNEELVKSTQKLMMSMTDLPTAYTEAQMAARGLTQDGLLLSHSYDVQITKAPVVKSALMEEMKAKEESARKTREMKDAWDGYLKDLAGSFETLANIAGDSGLGGVAKTMGELVGAMSLGSQAGKQMDAGLTQMQKGGMQNVATGALGMATGIMGAVGSMQKATDHASATKNILGGMASGMATGMQIAGPWGAAVGAAVGAIWGAFKGKPDWAKIQEDIKKDFGVAVTQELAKEIEALAKTLEGGTKEQRRKIAEALSLSKIIAEGGGLNAANILKYQQQAFTLFDVIKKGGETGEKAVGELNNLIGMFGQSLLQSGKLADDSFLKLIEGARASGKEFANVSAFIVGQVQTNIIGGLNQWVNATKSSTTANANAVKELADVQAKIAKGGTDNEIAELKTREKALQATLAANAGALHANAIATEAEAYALTGSVMVAFTELRKQGVSTGEAIKQLSPIIDFLGSELEKTGIDGGEAFNSLRSLAKTAGDSVVSNAIAAVDGLNKTMVGLHNIGMMDQGMFEGLSSQVGKTFNDLVAQGKNGNDAMRLMQPTLQTLDELQRKFGFTTDQATQDLLDQARASGVVGKQYESDSSRMTAATEKMASVLEAMAKFMGVEVPAAADAMGNAGVKNLDSIAAKIKAGTIPTLQEMQGVVKDPAAFQQMLAAATDANGKIDASTRERIIATLYQMQGVAADGGPWRTMEGTAINVGSNIGGYLSGNLVGSIRTMQGVAADGQPWGNLAGNAQNAAGNAAGAMGNLSGAVQNTWGQVSRSDAWGNMAGNAQNAAGNAKSALDGIQPVVGNVWGRVSDGSPWRTMAGNAENAAGAARSALSRIPTSITTTVNTVYTSSGSPSGGGGGGGGGSDDGGGGGGSGYTWDSPEVRSFLANNPGDEGRAREIYGLAKGGIATRPSKRWFAEYGPELAMPLPKFEDLISRMGSAMAMQTQEAKQAYMMRSTRDTGGGATTVEVHLDLRGTIVDTERTVTELAQRVGDKIADKYYRGAKVNAT